MMIKTALTSVTLAEAGGLSVLGIAIVFAMLVALMVVVVLLARVFKEKKNKTVHEESTAAAVSAAPVVRQASTTQPVSAAQPATANNEPAPGSAGVIKLYDVPEKQAAMVMAIVANHLNVPLNQLRFKSIKRVD